MEKDNRPVDISHLPLDDQFLILLHKKIMNKSGSARRRTKQYYTAQYRKTGLIPAPLLLASKGIFEGRKCSGRLRSLDIKVKKRFIEMVKASTDPLTEDFIFITRKARTIKNYHFWLEEEFKQKIPLVALRRCVKAENLKSYLEKPDFGEEVQVKNCFKAEGVFDLIQVDGCTLRYLKIRDTDGRWKKPQVIEFFDTGSRYMFVLDLYFSESSQNAVDLFTQFLLSTPFPQKEIRLRPDNAKGFLNLKRSMNVLNLKHSLPGGFYLKPDFSRVNAPKDKVHLESSHRTLHNFEIRIIKTFAHRIFKKEPAYLFQNGNRQPITITYLDISLDELRTNGIVETYRREHNASRRYFSDNGKTLSWIPEQKLENFLAPVQPILFAPADVQEFVKYGFPRIKATVSDKGTITFDNRKYYVAVGAENFHTHKSTTVYISHLADKLLIFEYKDDGLLLGEALCQEPFEKPTSLGEDKIIPNEVEQIAQFLKQQGMVIEKLSLIDKKNKGLTLATAKEIYHRNKARYDNFLLKLNHPPENIGIVMFNAFILDCERHQRITHVAPYASYGEE